MPTKSKVTSKKAASAASSVLKDGRTSTKSKTAAGSALSQRPSGKTKQPLKPDGKALAPNDFSKPLTPYRNLVVACGVFVFTPVHKRK